MRTCRGTCCNAQRWMSSAAKLTHLGTKRTSQKICRASPARASIHREALTLRRSFFRHFTVHMSWSFFRARQGPWQMNFSVFCPARDACSQDGDTGASTPRMPSAARPQIRPVLYLWHCIALCTVYAHMIFSAAIDHASPLWQSRTGQIENSKRRCHASLSSNRSFSWIATKPG